MKRARSSTIAAEVSLGARAILLASLLGGCSAAEATQLVVVVDTDLAIPSELDEIRVEVRGPDGVRQTEAAELADGSLLPLTLGVAPRDGSLGPITVTATGRLAGVTVVERMHRVTLVAGETRTLIMHLAAACAERDAPCASGETCGENGCVDIELDVATLPRWGGTPPRLGDDAGPPPPRDAGPDALVPPPDGAVDGGEDGGPPPCGGPEDCDDANACTDDVCTAGGCAWTPNAAACDDGVFCNGLDTCDAGSCSVHAGAPCVGTTTCDEATGTCTGCGSDADCPAATTGAWSTCAYAGTCAESGSQTRTVRTFACTGGACVPADADESRACTRTTSGDVCATPSCGAWSACGGYADGCDESGSRTRSCTTGACTAGACVTSTMDETGACSRETDGSTCGMASCTAWSGCAYGSTCAESGSESRSCTTAGSCVAGSCSAPAPATEMRACTRDTDGDSCGAAASCGAWGACSYSSTCDESASRTRTCTTAQTCAAGSCAGGSEYVDTGSCSRDTDGDSCGTESCSAWTTCSTSSGVECDTSGTQTRTCTPIVCAAASCGSGAPRTDMQGCIVDVTGDPCDDGIFCTDGDFCRSTGLCRGFPEPGCIEP